MKKSIVLCFLFFVIMVTDSFGDTITKDRAIEIAKKQAISMNYNVESKAYEIYEDITPWKKEFPNLGSFNSLYDDIDKFWEGKKYWVVYFHPNSPAKGGDLLVIIDSKFGDLILTYRGH